MSARRKSPGPECDITGKPLTEIAFEAAHPKTDLKFKNLDRANAAIWERVVAAVAEAVRRKDAGISQRKAA